MKPLFLVPLLLLSACDKKPDAAETAASKPASPVSGVPQAPGHPSTAFAEKVRSITQRSMVEMDRIKKEYAKKLEGLKDSAQIKAINDEKYKKLRELKEAVEAEIKGTMR